MLQNIKVDIIYYLTSTDFEMEFNLCGCCRMRLLTDKASDQKSLINILARDVSRSRIIIACGPLFKENGLISVVSTAIGSPLTDIDENTYNIKDASGIKIIKGSTPLITSEGYFGGCIIESGPQTIILISENKGIRKRIMSSLIHPYIEELSLSPIQPAPSTNLPNADTEDTSSETEEAVSDTESPDVSKDASMQESETESSTDEVSENTKEAFDNTEDTSDNSSETSDVTNTEALENSDESTPEKEKSENNTRRFSGAELEMYIEPEHVKFNKKNAYAIDYTPSVKDNMFIASSDTDDFDTEPTGHAPKVLNLFLIITGALLGIVIVFLIYCLFLSPLLNGNSISEHIKNIFTASNAALNFMS